MTQSHGHFADRLADAMDLVQSFACIGLDPVLERLPETLRTRNMEPIQAIDEFCRGVIQAVAGLVPIIKPQSACFERYGPAGLMVLRGLTRFAHEHGLLVLLDAKRGDIGVTAEHYATASFGPDSAADYAADAITLSGYMGPDTIEPFLKSSERGAFVLVRTSNPGSDAVQGLKLADGRTVAESMADLVHELGRSRIGSSGLSCVGAVVGATKSADAASLRAHMPDTIFLIPGYGAQGGTLDDLRPCIRPKRAGSASSAGILVNASRSVLYPKNLDAASAWQDAIRSSAMQLVQELRSV